jgi:hypothetical protein
MHLKDIELIRSEGWEANYWTMVLPIPVHDLLCRVSVTREMTTS